MQIFKNTETILKQCFAYFLVHEVTEMRLVLGGFSTEWIEDDYALGILWVGLMRFSALIAKSQYQSLRQRIFLRLRLKGVNLLRLLFVSLGRSTDTFRNNVPVPWPLVEYLLRLESLYIKWDPCILFGQIRYTMEKQWVIMTSDNQQTSLTCICNLEGKGS